MQLKWTDSLHIAEELLEKYPNVDAKLIRFTDLHSWVCGLDSFDDDPEKSNEKILEAIQMHWIEEQEE